MKIPVMSVTVWKNISSTERHTHRILTLKLGSRVKQLRIPVTYMRQARKND